MQSVCDYLAIPGRYISIHDNATGCNSQQEVEEACRITTVDEAGIYQNITIYPNPSSTQITIELCETPLKNTSLSIYNISGQQLISRLVNEPKTEIDISNLPTGIYIVKLQTPKEVITQKLVVN